MINPNSVTNFHRSAEELLEFWIFCLFVRGKNADVQAKKLDQFWHVMGKSSGVLSSSLGDIEDALIAVKSGQYSTLAPAIHETAYRILVEPAFLRDAPVEQFESIYGVGPKTARFFLLHTRENARVAALDTHILQYLAAMSNDVKMPKTPKGEKYATLEREFLLYADFYGVDPATFDLAIWRASRESHPLDWRNYVED